MCLFIDVSIQTINALSSSGILKKNCWSNLLGSPFVHGDYKLIWSYYLYAIGTLLSSRNLLHSLPPKRNLFHWLYTHIRHCHSASQSLRTSSVSSAILKRSFYSGGQIRWRTCIYIINYGATMKLYKLMINLFYLLPTRSMKYPVIAKVFLTDCYIPAALFHRRSLCNFNFEILWSICSTEEGEVHQHFFTSLLKVMAMLCRHEYSIFL